jgi:hypothetical protein
LYRPGKSEEFAAPIFEFSGAGCGNGAVRVGHTLRTFLGIIFDLKEDKGCFDPVN